MGNFRCSTCGTPSRDAAGRCACGSRTFVLSPAARVTTLHLAEEPEGRLVSISDAPSWRRAHPAEDGRPLAPGSAPA